MSKECSCPETKKPERERKWEKGGEGEESEGEGAKRREEGEMGWKRERRDEGEKERERNPFHQPFGFTDSFYF